MQILDREIEFDDLDKEHSERNNPENTVLALMGSNAKKWKSVEDTLPWHTNSWKCLLAITRQLYHWPHRKQGNDVHDYRELKERARAFWF